VSIGLFPAHRSPESSAQFSLGIESRLATLEQKTAPDTQDTDLLLAQTTELLTRDSLYNGHPRFLGYVTSSPAPIGMLADLLAAAVNPNVGA
jgi:glutamate/tyrosine decarboxylase-like PLP-dependent enzyme